MCVSIVALNHSNILKRQQCAMWDHWFWIHDNWWHNHDDNWLWLGEFGWPKFPCACFLFRKHYFKTDHHIVHFIWHLNLIHCNIIFRKLDFTLFQCGYGYQNQAKQKLKVFHLISLEMFFLKISTAKADYNQIGFYMLFHAEILLFLFRF